MPPETFWVGGVRVGVDERTVFVFKSLDFNIVLI